LKGVPGEWKLFGAQS